MITQENGIMWSSRPVTLASRKVTVFSHSTLEYFKHTNKNLKRAISAEQEKIKLANDKINTNQPRFDILQERRATYDAQISSSCDAIRTNELYRSITSNNPWINFCMLTDASRCLAANSNKAQIEKEFIYLEHLLAENQAIIHEASKRMTSFENERFTTKKRIRKCQEYLDKLENYPHDLFQDFENMIIDRLEKNATARATLDSMRKKINFIKNTHLLILPSSQKKQNPNLLWRARCAYLCGLVWSTFNKVNHTNSSPPTLANLLMCILQEMHIPENQGLPCAPWCGTRYTCKYMFDELARLTHSLTITSTYEKILSAMREEVTHLCQKYPEHKYFYNRILKKTYHLHARIGKKDFLTLYNQYSKLTNQVPGKSSHGHKLVGLMLMMSGLVLLTLSGVGFFYGGWPLVGWFAKAGVSLTSQGAALTTGLTSVGFFSMARYFISRSGISKQMALFADTANKDDRYLKKNKIRLNISSTNNIPLQPLSPSAPPPPYSPAVSFSH